MKLTTKQLRQLIRESIRGDMDFQTRGRHDDVVPSELDKFNREEEAERKRQRAKVGIAKNSGNKAAMIKAYTNALASRLFKGDEEEAMEQSLAQLQGTGKQRQNKVHAEPYSRKLEKEAEAQLLSQLKKGIEANLMDLGKYRPESLTAKLMNDFKSDWKTGKYESPGQWAMSKIELGQYAKKPGMMSKIGKFFGFQESLNITSEQLKNIIKEELNEMMEMDTDVWSLVESLKHSGMTESGMMIELDKIYTAGAAGPDAARQWGEWMSYAGLQGDYQAQSGDLVSWQQQRGAAGLVDDLKKVAEARGARM